jgi:hypothetical protein
MSAMESFSGFATAPSTTNTAITMSNGTLTVRQFNQGNAYLFDTFKNGQAANGYWRIRSPKFHDNVQGLRFQNIYGATRQAYPFGFPQQVTAQDTLIVEDTGSAVGGDIENIVGTLFYENLPSNNANLIGLDELERRMALVPEGYQLFTATGALVGATSGAWGTAQALSALATGDLTKANTDYALLGIAQFSESAANNGCAVSLTGPATGNFMVAMPLANAEPNTNIDYFIRMTKAYKRGCIPVINAADKGGTFFSVLNNENANTVNATFLFARLG